MTQPATARGPRESTGQTERPRGARARRRVGRLATVALWLAAVGCSGGGESVDLMGRLAEGVFVDDRGVRRLGAMSYTGELPLAAIWQALPFTPVSPPAIPGRPPTWMAPTLKGWHPVGARAVLERVPWSGEQVESPQVSLQIHRGPNAEGDQAVTVVVDGQIVGEAELVQGPNDLTFPVEASAFGQPGTFELLFDPPLVRRGFQPPPYLLTALGLVDGADPVTVNPEGHPTLDPESGRLRIVGRGTLVVPLDLPAGSRSIELELRCEGPRRLALSILDRGGEVWGELAPEDCRDGWTRLDLPLEARRGLVNTLSLDVDGASQEGVVEIRAARLGLESVVDSASAEDAPVMAVGPRATPGQQPPDILLVILDAARAENFGYAGYERDTTPNFDRLAAESLVFERAYSECATTSCSIPNLITGIPFLNLGTVFQGKRLPDEVVTLAEYLQPLGYRSIGLSANPNNAPSRNSHQGFDYFERLSGVFHQTDLAIDFITEQPPDQPLFLELHYLPPHQPYMPTEEFDLFTDPDYEGIVHPKLGLRRYSAGLDQLPEEDIEQLLALYDGNLRMVDDAVERVFEAMRAAGRWDNTLVLLTSDHGEAFGEHDTFQHNSTVYDEMLHVPFLIRLPGGFVPAGIDTTRPVALADVVPTILGYLGLEPRPEVWGVDLLAPRPSGEAERFLFHRTFHANRPLMTIRDGEWKAITGRGVRRPELYDLTNDPGELENLASRQRAHYSGMILRLREFLIDWESRVPESHEDVELSEEETKLLRSLGYVE